MKFHSGGKRGKDDRFHDDQRVLSHSDGFSRTISQFFSSIMNKKDIQKTRTSFSTFCTISQSAFLPLPKLQVKYMRTFRLEILWNMRILIKNKQLRVRINIYI